MLSLQKLCLKVVTEDISFALPFLVYGCMLSGKSNNYNKKQELTAINSDLLRIFY